MAIVIYCVYASNPTTASPLVVSNPVTGGISKVVGDCLKVMVLNEIVTNCSFRSIQRKS